MEAVPALHADGLSVAERLRNELIESIERQFDVATRTLRLGGVELAVFALRDPDTLLDEATINAAHGDMAWHPYWGKLWDSAIGLADYLADRDFSGTEVLDLGCGLGVTGAIVAARGGRVIMADHAPPTLDFARLNSWPWRERVEVRWVDWRTSDLRHSFDLIVGADIVYDRHDVPFLDRFWRNHLGSAGQVILSDPSRLMTLDLLPMLEASGWSIERRAWTCGELTRPINIFTLTQSAVGA
jgi:predicted nicotinamide N-methyase